MAAGSRWEADMIRTLLREIGVPAATLIIALYALGFILP